jgi:hypothetical protein
MKPAPFEYERAADLASALSALARYGSEAKVLAGGQILIPMLNLRLASSHGELARRAEPHIIVGAQQATLAGNSGGLRFR